MSITIKVAINQTFSMVVEDSILEQIAAERVKAREVSPEKVATLTGQKRYYMEVFRSERTDEEVLRVVFKDSLIECAKEAATEMNQEGIRVKGHQTVVTFPEPNAKIASALARSCDCNACYECKIANGGRDE
ncbi:hypothetical protein phiPSA2_25 [Pseudomonas phage phiPSA2]|uniref:Uncharacterized protein n=1 Tax=Pseudomonas phage phiPSA2 TaxID=1500756 RepID=A0A059VJP3_9CAUD|nr:Gp5.5-like host HNS inhibition [Pseudomonas phage phiPSA2]AHZ95006.1 hypothetical protein phiPSA2_25 [Pseudomonas phage phiPSA2]